MHRDNLYEQAKQIVENIFSGKSSAYQAAKQIIREVEQSIAPFGFKKLLLEECILLLNGNGEKTQGIKRWIGLEMKSLKRIDDRKDQHRDKDFRMDDPSKDITREWIPEPYYQSPVEMSDVERNRTYSEHRLYQRGKG